MKNMHSLIHLNQMQGPQKDNTKTQKHTIKWRETKESYTFNCFNYII